MFLNNLFYFANLYHLHFCKPIALWICISRICPCGMLSHWDSRVDPSDKFCGTSQFFSFAMWKLDEISIIHFSMTWTLQENFCHGLHGPLSGWKQLGHAIMLGTRYKTPLLSCGMSSWRIKQSSPCAQRAQVWDYSPPPPPPQHTHKQTLIIAKAPHDKHCRPMQLASKIVLVNYWSRYPASCAWSPKMDSSFKGNTDSYICPKPHR